MKPFVSVIIPLYRDWYRLALCIKALHEQDYDRFEVIIINNCEAENVPDGFYLPANFRIINEFKPGSYAARNAGIKKASGSIIAFTDSDCIPDKSWLSNAINTFETDLTCSRIAGKIEIFYSSSKPNNAELYEKVYAFNQDLYVQMDGTGVTANLIVKREVLDAVGLFDEELLSGGDYEWSVRARNAGYKICYDENVRISHPARSRITQLVTKAKRVGGGQAGFTPTHNRGYVKRIFRFMYDLRPPVRSIPLIKRKGKDMALNQKLTVFFIHYYLSLVTAVEKFKVALGKEPSRA
jgi:GT2 family glycosyltransferase